MVDFTGMRNTIGRKVAAIKELVPDIAGEMQGEFDKFTNELSQAGNSVGAVVNEVNSYYNQGGFEAGRGISSITDDIFSATKSPQNFRNNLSEEPGPIGTTTKVGTLVPGQSQPPWPNELKGFASMNTIITLSALSKAEINDPDGTYRTNGISPESIICRSGGSGTAKVKTAYEKVLGKTLEFFIDDLNIQSIMSPGIGTRNTSAQLLDFKISEPYSMGLFIQALKHASLEGGFLNYIEGAFLLTIEFVGTDEEGNMGVAPYSRRYIPMRFKKVNFSVNESGSEYDVKAMVFNDQSLSDAVQRIKSEITITGQTVREILQSGGQSLTTLLNTREFEKAEKGISSTPDQYVIVFPKDLTSATGKPQSGWDSRAQAAGRATAPTGYYQMDGFENRRSSTGMTKLEINKQYQSITGDLDEQAPANFDEYLNTVSGVVKSSSELGKSIKEYANSDLATNFIGKSLVITDQMESGQSPMGQQKYAQDNKDTYPIFSRGSSQLQMSGTNRMFKFKQGSRIQDIIEEILLVSAYGQALAKQLNDIKDPTGMVTWYRIETDCKVIEENSQVTRTGKGAKVYIYRIVPFKVHSSLFNNPATPATGVAKLKSEVAKEYNYIYSGRNEDILEFDIDYNYVFMANIVADGGSSTADVRMAAANKTLATKKAEAASVGRGPIDDRYGLGATADLALKKAQLAANNATEEAKIAAEGLTGVAESINDSSTKNGGSTINNVDITIARAFNERMINSPVDMVRCTMKILGDPFYLSDNGHGNYHAGDTSYTNMTKDGQANFNNGFCHINILFRTPLDISQDHGNYQFPEDTELVEAFSGIYRVQLVTHSFSKNQFTQELTLLRINNQQASNLTSRTGVLVKSPIEQAYNDKLIEINGIAASGIEGLDFPNNVIENKESLDELLPALQELGSIYEQAKASLNTDAAATFGKIGEIAKQISEADLDFDLAKIGRGYDRLVGTISEYTGKIPGLENIQNPISMTTLPAGVLGDARSALEKINSKALGEQMSSLNSNLANKIDMPNVQSSSSTDVREYLSARGPF